MAQPLREREIPELYRETVGTLYAFVSRRCFGERALAEDIVQETWLRAVDTWRSKGVPAEPAAWLTTVARNLLINHVRRRRPMALDAVNVESALAVVDDGFATGSAASARLIQWGLARLSTRDAGLLEAFHFDERPVADIASAQRLSVRAVEGRLRRARQKLRREVEKAMTRGRRR